MKLNKNLVISAVVIAAALIFFVQWPVVRTKKIIVVASHGSSAHIQIYKGIADAALRSKYRNAMNVIPYWFDTDDKIKTTAVCEAALDAKPDLIIASGRTCSQILHELKEKRQNKAPMVFLGVNHAVELGLVNSFEHPGGHITGVIVQSVIDASVEAKLISIVKPSVKKVMIPCDVLGDIDGVVMMAALNVKSQLESQGVVADIVTLNGLSNAMQVIKTSLSHYDLLIVLELDLLKQLSVGVAKLCEEVGVTFFCSAFDGIAAGAAITYATSTAYLGIQAVSLATKILFEGGDPATMPVISLSNTRDLYINTKTAPLQGYQPDIAQIKKDLAADPELNWLAGRVKIIE